MAEIPIKSKEEDSISIEKLDKIVHNINKFKNLKFPFDFQINQYNYFEDIIKYEFLPRIIDIDSPMRVAWSYSNNRLCDSSMNSNLELDIDIILDFFSKVSPQLDQELYLKYIRKIINETNKNRYSSIEKKWSNENIQLFRVIEEKDIEYPDRGIYLKSILVVRKFNYEDEKEKYIFYEFSSDDNKFEKKTYEEMIYLIKKKKMKICNKFGKRCENSENELEI